MTDGNDRPATDVQAAPGKADPETLALRAQPARAIRFKRGAIVAIAALGSVSLVATAWVALRPSNLQLVGQADDRTIIAKPPTDALSALPGGYGDVPKLGPPLPGDLGRPILDHQRAMGTEPVEGEAARADQAAATERERRAAELRAARESGLLVQSGSRPIPTAEAQAALPLAPVASADAPRPAVNPDRDPNAQQRKADFVAKRDSGGDVNGDRLTPPASPNMLSAGSVIAAGLITGLRSDLPGLVTAQVTERVYDSATGSILLIPQGARLIGSYDSVVAYGQKRALIVWQRIILPDGSSIRLDNVPATDPSGYAGLADKVDFHTWTLLKGVAISTLLGVGANLSFSGESDLVQAIRESTQQNVSRAGDQITSRNLQVQPTITIRPGAPVRLVVHRDLILAPWRG
ncbi:conjugal transfer protein TrbI [Sphingomonas sp. R647]|uniref:TrbI/VirB10 family protein n=1 Tax=unclassified Sphingomonas TaxID=196159 RepID=UPI001CD36D1B|nr:MULTISPECIES: TrbI/VirB10 family protein [unclassified Sphingomonas]MCA1197936.1 conjugal transfer protein TrbI [Sphingomonas sp. R647]MCR5871319.1 conjugal transfer protein TrbI [Sphingomonas sp. J344]UUY00377.1 conjugal transfer protein TrbI [Sphingomonas sp. J315]